MRWHIEVLRQYAVYQGRARRKKFRMFILFHNIVVSALGAIEVFFDIGSGLGKGVLQWIYLLAV